MESISQKKMEKRSKMELTSLKKGIQKRQPNFLRQDGHKRKKLKPKWRKPKGIHSKMRDKRRGYRVVVSTGYGTPKILRTLNKDGKKEYLVKSINDLQTIPNNSLIVLQAGMGAKTKIKIIEIAKTKKLTFVNLNVETFNKNLEIKKAAKQKTVKEDTKKKKTLEQVADKEKKKEEEKTDETDDEKKKKEKEERDKVLTKRN
jgi:large subunit ribosomal protein L32e